jgi:hypothetical protein
MITIELKSWDESDVGMGILREYLTIGRTILYVDERFDTVEELTPIEALQMLSQEKIDNIKVLEKLSQMEIQRQIELLTKKVA